MQLPDRGFGVSGFAAFRRLTACKRFIGLELSYSQERSKAAFFRSKLAGSDGGICVQEFGKMENMGGMMEGLGGIDPSQARPAFTLFAVQVTCLYLTLRDPLRPGPTFGGGRSAVRVVGPAPPASHTPVAYKKYT